MMADVNVRISDLAKAPSLADGWADQVISLVDLDCELPVFQVKEHLVLRVVDTCLWMHPYVMRSGDAERVFKFAKRGTKKLVHCQGGMSRSTATAISLMIRDGMSVKEATLEAYKQRPMLSPNRLILRLFDTLLDMRGLLVGEVYDVLATLPKPQGLLLWCSECKVHFIDGEGCGGGHFQPVP